MHSDYELRLPRDIQPGDWIKVEGSDRPSLVLRAIINQTHDPVLILAAFDSQGCPSSQAYSIDWHNQDVPLSRLRDPYVHFGDVGHVVDAATEWTSPFALTMSDPDNEGSPTTSHMVRVGPGRMRDPIYFAPGANSGNTRNPNYRAPVHEFGLWASTNAMQRSEAPLIHYRTAAVSHDSTS